MEGSDHRADKYSLNYAPRSIEVVSGYDQNEFEPRVGQLWKLFAVVFVDLIEAV